MNPKAYEQLFKLQDNHWWYVGRTLRIKKTLDKLDIPKGTSLDIGCGTGNNFELLKEYSNEIIGVDLSDDALKFANEKFPNVKTIKCDANEISNVFKGEKFCLIIVLNVLYHQWIKNDIDVLNQLTDLLDPGGVLLITEPAFNILKRPHDIQVMGNKRYHFNYFNRVFNNKNYSKIHRSYFNFISFLPALLISLVAKLIPQETDGDVDELKVNPLINKLMIIYMKIENLLPIVPLGVTLLIAGKKRDSKSNQ